MLQAGVLVGEPAGAAFYRGNARCLIFHWVEEVDSLLPAARMWGGESEGGPSASALASPPHSAPHRASLQPCPEGGSARSQARATQGLAGVRGDCPAPSSGPFPFLLESQGLSSPALGGKTTSWPISQVSFVTPSKR